MSCKDDQPKLLSPLQAYEKMGHIFTEIIQPTWSTFPSSDLSKQSFSTTHLDISFLSDSFTSTASRTESFTLTDWKKFIHAPSISQARAALQALIDILEPRRKSGKGRNNFHGDAKL